MERFTDGFSQHLHTELVLHVCSFPQRWEETYCNGTDGRRQEAKPGERTSIPKQISPIEAREEASTVILYFWGGKCHPVTFLGEEEVRAQQGE